MSKTSKIVAGIIVVVLIIWGITASRKGGTEDTVTIKIGVIAPMTRNAATYGEQVKKGIDIAIERIKKEGKVNIELIIEDNQFDPKIGLTAYNKLAKVDKVKYLITFGGNVCPIINPLAQKDQIVNFATGCNTLDFKDNFSYNFRFDVSEAAASRALIKYAQENLQTKRLALLYVNNDWGTIVAKTIKNAAQEKGIDIIAEETFLENSRDARTQVAKLKQAKPDSIFFVSLVNFTPTLLKQISDGELEAHLLTNISIQGSTPKDLGSYAERIIYSAPKLKQVDSPRNSAFNAVFPDPNSRNFASWGFDSLNLFADALEKVGDNKQEVATYLHNLKNYPGAFGEISYDNYGELNLDYQIKQVRDGKFVEIE